MLMRGKCTHSAAKAKNCNYCPDCGEKIVQKWAIIRCKTCGHYRKPVIDNFNKIKPAKKYCFNCGSITWDVQYYFESTIPEKMKVIAVKQVFKDEENNIFKTKESNVKIWLSK